MEQIERYKKLLAEYVSKVSISTDISCLQGIEDAVAWLDRFFKEHGFGVTIVRGYDNPIIIAKYVVDPAYETCLIYGHYDVQPAVKEEGWTENPFLLSEKRNRLFARGAVDNKGQNLIHLVAITDLIQEKKLGYNITFLLEGNEETGSPLLGKFIEEHRELLASDFSMISDGELTACTPAIETGFRGGFNATLTVSTATHDLHSGIYGSASPNSVHELSKFIASLYDTDNRIAIRGFYDDVDGITDEIAEVMKKVPFNFEEYKRVSGTNALLLQEGMDFNTQTGLMPSIEVTGIQSGYTGAGYRNSIPASATAKINFRLVLSQDPERIVILLRKHAAKHLPSYVSYTLEISDPYIGVKLPIDNPFVEKARHILTSSYHKEPVFSYCGGGLPIVTYFVNILHIPNLLIPMGNGDCMMHAADENFSLDHILPALAFSSAFFSNDTN